MRRTKSENEMHKLFSKDQLIHMILWPLGLDDMKKALRKSKCFDCELLLHKLEKVTDPVKG